MAYAHVVPHQDLLQPMTENLATSTKVVRLVLHDGADLISNEILWHLFTWTLNSLHLKTTGSADSYSEISLLRKQPPTWESERDIWHGYKNVLHFVVDRLRGIDLSTSPWLHVILPLYKPRERGYFDTRLAGEGEPQGIK